MGTPNDALGINVRGHVKIEDDLGNVLLDKDNAVHPQNLARAFGRALSRESNFWIHRIAYGNGGTVVDAAQQITYKTPNDGQAPDANTWDSRLYKETYSEIVDDTNVSIGTDPGSFGPEGIRPGGGTTPDDDPQTIEHVSGPGVRSSELGLTTEVVIVSVLNPGEPGGQVAEATREGGSTEDTEADFMFDEIGLYTTGSPAVDSPGYKDIDINNKTATSPSTLDPNTSYEMTYSIDGGASQVLQFTTPAAGGTGPNGEITYGDIAEAINTSDAAWTFVGATPGSPATVGATVAITNDDTANNYPSIEGAQTYGFFRVQSNTLGSTSSVELTNTTSGGFSSFIDAMANPSGVLVGGDGAGVGQDAGVQNDPVNPGTERERLLTHLIFSPILKSGNRTLVVTYTLTISIARTA